MSLIERSCFQIADFGLSNLYRRDEYLQTYCGSPLYASPEIVNGRPYKGPEVDSWSLGVLLYALVHEAMPFDGHDYRTLVRQISTGNYRKPTKPSGNRKCMFCRKLFTRGVPFNKSVEQKSHRLGFAKSSKTPESLKPKYTVYDVVLLRVVLY